MSHWRVRLHRVWRKHQPEMKGLFGGELPRWLAPGGDDALGEVPVFVFHDPEPASFEAYLRFLADNDYRSLTADELSELDGRVPTGQRLVVLTIDDALCSTRSVAFPLLREYGFRAVLFVVPTVVGHEDVTWPDLVDVRAGRATEEDLGTRARDHPFCTWSELAEMLASGVVDVQSHSFSHHRVPISPRVIDFVHPDLDLWHGNFDLPISVLDEAMERTPRPGAPLFASAPRLSGRPRFMERPELVRALVEQVEARGAQDFFASRSWRRRLRGELRNWPSERRGRFETPDETEAAMRREIVEGRDALASRLPGASVDHLAYPWQEGCALADRLALETGKRSVFYGPSIPAPEGPGPLRIRRLPESYLVRLPGRERAAFPEFLRIRFGRANRRWGTYA